MGIRVAVRTDGILYDVGSAGTLGQALAESFAVAGANLWLVYNRTPPSELLKDRCLSLGARSVKNVQCDVASLKECRSLSQRVRQTMP
jgi:NAD(P)-dependent dehydrogenase (short-subunit alcohol dehydrogenase family)